MYRTPKSRDVCVTILAALATGITLGTGAFGQEQRSVDPGQPVNVYICDSPTVTITPWRQTLVRAIGRAVASPRGTRGHVMGEARCGADAVEFACTAGVYDRGGRVLVCSPETLLKLIRVSA